MSDTPAQAAYTVPEFLSTHRIGRTKFYEELKAKRLVARKLGTKTLIAADDARAWLKNLPPVDTAAA